MLTLNGKKFARTDSEFTESLFQSGGTCVGYYVPKAHEIELQNMQREKVGVINRHAVLCCASRRPDGRFWYSHADIKEVGRYASYSHRVEELQTAIATHCKGKA